jgi:hypothetical protein
MYSSAFVLVANFRHFSIYKTSPEQHGQGNFLQNFLKKKSPCFDKESYEIAKVFWRIWVAFFC